ncbi:AraC family transcriptional regulator [Candidatus Thiothrix sp. Deng01]|uniref:AraC family transcriptional regulator n=1 Tax=Candidatus Thiothrix phosphatis TaxID=3112415 RepID=A0ABU6CXF6_9GAMM|nr:AraC family transcriptional regulator [Candidatus Thiothrix sp. Deng01]MEB4590793.1 AraC family transcriptional regulator [Candidatus Thiothrix sp. Deng01]
MDRLEALFNHFSVRASLFHSGKLCGVNDFPAEEGKGQMHLLKAGILDIQHPGQDVVTVTEPSLLLYPQPLPRRFVSDNKTGADLVCANLHFDGGVNNPIVAALPEFVCLPLAAVEGMGSVLALLFEEAFEQRCGRQVLLNRLFEVILIQVLRHMMEAQQVNSGMLAGMGHPKLRKALVAMHEQPANEWTLEELAATAGMSRSVFAGAFRETVGCTAGAYLQGWRIGLAQQALRNGRALRMIVGEVGYGSEAAFSRAFKAQCGMSPREWLRTVA